MITYHSDTIYFKFAVGLPCKTKFTSPGPLYALQYLSQCGGYPTLASSLTPRESRDFKVAMFNIHLNTAGKLQFMIPSLGAVMRSLAGLQWR